MFVLDPLILLSIMPVVTYPAALHGRPVLCITN